MYLKTTILALAISLPLLTSAVEFNDLGPRAQTADAAAEGRLVIKFKDSSVLARAKISPDRVGALAGRANLALSSLRELGANMQLIGVDDRSQSLEAIAAQLRTDADIDFVALDRRRFAHTVPTDPLFPGQWYLQTAQTSAIRADGAWDRGKGSAGIVIAVLDTGVRFDHPDLGRAAQGGKLLPGYDFVSADSNGGFLVANDGSGWDADPSDPGDWISSSDAATAQFKGCSVSNSSWHGTRTAGMIAAASNGAAGITGVDWNAWLLPVRVLGKCGGFDSDIIAAMRWAAGIHVNGVPDNPYPARIINMSLGNVDTSQCQTYQPVVNELTARGVLVVASAGNEGGPVDEPADCRGVLAVAGLRHAGTKVGYSSLGPQVGISAPAGNCVNVNGGPCLYSLDTTTNLGKTTAAGSSYTDQTNFNLGTSFAAPQAAGVASLMLAINGKLDSAALIARVQRGARTFPTPALDAAGQPLPVCRLPTGVADLQNSECVCNTQVCGAGMLNAAGGVEEAFRPLISIVPGGPVAAGGTVTFDSSASTAACGRTLSTRAWSAVDEIGQPVALVSSDQTSTTLTVPSSGRVTLSLVLTDNGASAETASVNLTSTSAGRVTPVAITTALCPAPIKISAPSSGGSTPPASTPSSGGGVGGGALGASSLALLLGLLTLGQWRRRRLE